MNINPITILVTIFTGLLIAGIVAWIKKPRLVVLVPRLFTYSQITEQGQLVEVTVLNRGFKTEENIEVTLNSHLHYEVLGSSSQDISLIKNKIVISRIGSASDVTVLLVVEKGLFKASDDIIECLSKETKGIVVSSIAEIPVTGSFRIGLTIFFSIALCTIFYLLYEPVFEKGELITGASHTTSVEEKKELKTSSLEPLSNLTGWNVPELYKSRELYKAFADKRLSFDIGDSVIEKDNVTIPFVLQNSYSEPVKFVIDMTTVASEKTIPSYKRFLSVIVLPGTSEKREITVRIPENTISQSDRTVYIDTFLEARNGETLKMTRDNVIPISESTK